MAEPEKQQADVEFHGERLRIAPEPFKGPWTEADELFVEFLTGEYDARIEREADEFEARETDL